MTRIDGDEQDDRAPPAGCRYAPVCTHACRRRVEVDRVAGPARRQVMPKSPRNDDEVVRPAVRHGARRDGVLEDEVPADDPGEAARRAWRRRRCRRCRRPAPSRRTRRSRARRARSRSPATTNESDERRARRTALAASPVRTKMPAPMMRRRRARSAAPARARGAAGARRPVSASSTSIDLTAKSCSTRHLPPPRPRELRAANRFSRDLQRAGRRGVTGGAAAAAIAPWSSRVTAPGRPSPTRRPSSRTTGRTSTVEAVRNTSARAPQPSDRDRSSRDVAGRRGARAARTRSRVTPRQDAGGAGRRHERRRARPRRGWRSSPR